MLLWGMMSGTSISSLAVIERKNYQKTLGEQTASRIKHQAQTLCHRLLITSDIKPGLLNLTSPDDVQIPVLKTTFIVVRQGLSYLFTLSQLCCLRLSLLWFFLPCWGLLLITAMIDTWLMRRIRYHDFHYSSPTLNLWGYRLSQWLPIALLYSLIIPLPLPTLLIPVLSIAAALCLSWWMAQWQKRV